MSEPNQEQPKPRRKAKKAKGHGGHHGGAWKVAYADFVTAMMALFLVLWLVSQADTKLKESIANYFRSPGVFDSMDGGILTQAKKVSKEPTSLTSKDDEQALYSVAKSMQKKFEKRPEFSKYKDQLKIEITSEGLRIQIIDKADKVSFPSGSSELTPEAREILTEIASEICELPNKINIGGHTDSHVFSSEKGYTNWELSADRANAARRALEEVCVKPGQINRIVGFADTEPLEPDDPFAPSNRRISITVLKLSVEDEDGENADQGGLKPADNDINPLKFSPSKNITNKSSGNQKTEKSEVEDSKENSEDAETDSKNSEVNSSSKKVNNKKLKEEGSVKVGEPDEIPDLR